MADSSIFPTFDLEGRTFSKLILGHNPFLGGSYMSQARSRVYQETFTDYKAMERIIVKSIEMGVRGMMASTRDGFTQLLKKALFGAADKTGVLLPTIMIISRGFENQVEAYRELNCQVMLVHGQITDALYIKAKGTMQPEFGGLRSKLLSLRTQLSIMGRLSGWPKNSADTTHYARDYRQSSYASTA